MFFKTKQPIQHVFDDRIKTYLIYLAHAQNSISLSIAEKSDLIKAAEDISGAIFVSVERIRAKGVNAFNKAEVELVMKETMKRELKAVNDQIRSIDTVIIIDKSHPHSVKDAVASLIQTGSNRVVLSKDKIDRMFSFRQFFGMVVKPLDVRNETKAAAADFDKAYLGLEYKALQSMMLKPTYKGTEVYFRAITVVDHEIGARSIPISPREAFADGLAFIQNTEGYPITAYRGSGLNIEILVRLDRGSSQLHVFIQGFLDTGGTREDFYIDQIYSASLYDSVVNAFRLKKLLDAFGAKRNS